MTKDEKTLDSLKEYKFETSNVKNQNYVFVEALQPSTNFKAVPGIRNPAVTKIEAQGDVNIFSDLIHSNTISETWNVVQHVGTDLAEQTKNSMNSIGNQVKHFVQQTEEKVVDFSSRLDDKTKEALPVITGITLTQTALSPDGNLGSAAQIFQNITVISLLLDSLNRFYD
jgi:hypothetical protein